MKVIELVVEKTTHGWSEEELHLNPPHVTLGQIYSALAYYSDHQSELGKDIERRLQKIDKIRSVCNEKAKARCCFFGDHFRSSLTRSYWKVYKGFGNNS